MKIYQSEIECGLAEEIQASARISFDSIPEIKVQEEISYASLDLMENIGEQKDLALIQSILVSTGWNSNRDIFTPKEAWAARHTPVNKQVNFNHTDKIVGHMISSSVVDFNGKLINDDIDFEDLPEDFDIITAAVLYKKHPNEDLREAVAEILPKIANGEARVSMECLFNAFDYGLISSTGEQKIVTRNEKTAWLTKHLVQYGGKGEYNGCTLGRVIKNLTFSGKGIVDNPANKRSIIFSDMQKFSAANVINDTEFMSVSDTNITQKTEKEENMSEKETVSKEEYDKIVAQLEEIRKGEVAELQDKIATYDEAIAKLNDQIESLEDELAQAKEDSEKVSEEAKASKEELDSKSEELENLHKELDEIKAESMRRERVGRLISAGISEDEASTVAEEWSSASDEQFDKIVKMHKDVVDAKAGQEEETEAEELTDEEDETTASVDVEPEEEVTPAIGEDANEEEDVVATASAFLGSLINKK